MSTPKLVGIRWKDLNQGMAAVQDEHHGALPLFTYSPLPPQILHFLGA